MECGAEDHHVDGWIKQGNIMLLVFYIKANSVNPDQVAPKGAVLSACVWFDQNVSRPFYWMKKQTYFVVNVTLGAKDLPVQLLF